MEKTKTSPLSFIKKWCYDKRLYFFVFFLPVAIMFSAYAFFKIHPIGDSSVLVLDLNGQYVYYYEQFRDAFQRQFYLQLVTKPQRRNVRCVCILSCKSFYADTCAAAENDDGDLYPYFTACKDRHGGCDVHVLLKKDISAEA